METESISSMRLVIPFSASKSFPHLLASLGDALLNIVDLGLKCLDLRLQGGRRGERKGGRGGERMVELREYKSISSVVSISISRIMIIYLQMLHDKWLSEMIS